MVKTYISIDLETTGLQLKTDKIIEIGAVKVIEGEIAETFSSFICPKKELPEKIKKLTKITPQQLKDAPVIEEVFPKLLEFLEDFPLLGHKILFDYSFLKKVAVDQKITFEKRGIDTLKIARKYLPDLEHRNLEFLCRYYQIPIQPHRALEDARATSFLYQEMTKQFFQEEEKVFQPSALLVSVKRDTPATKAQREKLNYLLQKYHILLPEDVETLTRSQASRITDKIFAAYGR